MTYEDRLPPSSVGYIDSGPPETVTVLHYIRWGAAKNVSKPMAVQLPLTVVGDHSVLGVDAEGTVLGPHLGNLRFVDDVVYNSWKEAVDAAKAAR